MNYRVLDKYGHAFLMDNRLVNPSGSWTIFHDDILHMLSGFLHLAYICYPVMARRPFPR